MLAAGAPQLSLHDSRRRRREPFIAPQTVRVYVCGITPYDSSHLGHAFTYVVFDVISRVLDDAGHRVIQCRNVTDVDDDIVRVALDRGITPADLAADETKRFVMEMDALGLRRPDAEPHATEMIEPIVTAVKGLVRLGHAYPLPDGRVYFDTASVSGVPFGALMELDEEERIERFGEHGGDPDAPGKRSPLDFLLWQPVSLDVERAAERGIEVRPEDLPGWPSDWGRGRPGWHIECSVMAGEILGSTIDIHGGGRDLKFPHHEAEILQAEQLTGQAPFARFWMHTGMVGLDGETMSKSLGNLVYVRDLLVNHPAGGLRRYLLEHHYRDDWEFDADELDEAIAGFAGWRECAEATRDSDGQSGLTEAFRAAIASDLDTPTAIEVLDEIAKQGAGGTLRRLAAILGIDLLRN